MDDPRFSTAQVVGPSMLSLDGETHRRHRDPFAEALRGSDLRERLARRVGDEARRLVAAFVPTGAAEIRRDLAGPLAVNVVADALDLLDVAPGTVLGWYDEIVAAVDRVSVGGEDRTERAFRRGCTRDSRLGDHRSGSRRARGGRADAHGSRGRLERRGDDVRRDRDERGHDDIGLLAPADEPRRDGGRTGGPVARRECHRGIAAPGAAAGRVDRLCNGRHGARRRGHPEGRPRHRVPDGSQPHPATFPDPDRFDLARPNARSHVAFAQGPHACIGSHLARLETGAARTPRSTAGRGCVSPTARRHRPASCSGSRSRFPSAGMCRYHPSHPEPGLESGALSSRHEAQTTPPSRRPL